MSGRPLLPLSIRPVPATGFARAPQQSNSSIAPLPTTPLASFSSFQQTSRLPAPVGAYSSQGQGPNVPSAATYQTPNVPFSGYRGPETPTSTFTSYQPASNPLQGEDDRQTTGDGSIPEQLFPAGKISDLENSISASQDKIFIGLEYIIEIQHNTIKKTQNSYSCLLCDHQIKVPKDDLTTIAMAKAHLRSTAHKMNYLKKFFPRIKSKVIGDKKPVDHNLVNNLVEKIVEKYGTMKVKIVVGLKLFKKKCGQIKEMVENSSHYREDEFFIAEICGIDKETAVVKPKTRIDEYADAFEALEKGMKESDDKIVIDVEAEHRRVSEREKKPSRSRTPTRGSKRRSRSRSRSRRRSRSRSRHRRSRSRSRRYSRSPRSRRGGSRSRRSRSRSQRRRRSRSRSFSPRYRRHGGRHTRSRSRDRRGSRKPDSPRRSPMDEQEKERLIIDRDARVKVFIDEDKFVYRDLEQEKDRYIDNPEDHPGYSEEWRRFYSDKCFKHGMKLNPASLKDEWTSHWRNFLVRHYDNVLTNRRADIMKKLGITKDDIEDYILRKKVEAAKESQGRALQPPTSAADPSADRPKRDLDLWQEDVTVIKTLRLLSAIETLFDNVGLQIIQSLGRANILETTMGIGKSSDLLEDQKFVDLLSECRRQLQSKLVESKIPEKSLNVARICVDNVTILLQQSKCKTTPSTASDDKNSRLREIISETIRSEYQRTGQDLSPDQLSQLVEVELSRVLAIRSQMESPKRDGSRTSKSPSRAPIAGPSGCNPMYAAAGPAEKREVSVDSKATAVRAVAATEPEDDYDDLTIDELVSLYQNFTELDKETQGQLIEYMKKLELLHPEKVSEIQRLLQIKK